MSTKHSSLSKGRAVLCGRQNCQILTNLYLYWKSDFLSLRSSMIMQRNLCVSIKLLQIWTCRYEMYLFIYFCSFPLRRGGGGGSIIIFRVPCSCCITRVMSQLVLRYSCNCWCMRLLGCCMNGNIIYKVAWYLCLWDNDVFRWCYAQYV